MSDLPLIDPIRDAEEIIRSAQKNPHMYVTKDHLMPHRLGGAAKNLILSYGLMAVDIENPNIYYLTERGRNFKSFSDETTKHKQEVSLLKWAYLKSKYWIVIAVISFFLGSIVSPIVLEALKKGRQQQSIDKPIKDSVIKKPDQN